jgi:hypothetical protein
LRYDTSVADELVERGLWRRTKGGWRFHQWGNRNLLKERVEADLKNDRERKKASRNRGVDNSMEDSGEIPDLMGQNGSEQVNVPNVRPDSDRNPSGVQVDSAGIPNRSVSVSVSVSPNGSPRGERPVGRRALEDQRPPEKCPKHVNNPDPPPCGACADARRAVEAWDRANAVDTKSAIRACALCDGEGWRWINPQRRGLGTESGPGARCDHVRERVPT